MKDLILHAKTRDAVEQFISSPSHSLLIIAPPGAGKRHLANMVVTKILGLDYAQLVNYPYFLELVADSNTLSIEQVRQAQSFVCLKTTGHNSLRRAIVIPDANLMTTEAQNALLKLLEEPPSDTLIVMTSTSADQLLPTVVSRSQTILVRPPLTDDLREYFLASGATESEISAALHLSAGYVGLATDIVQNKESKKLEYIDIAKRLLTMTKFDRLIYVNQFTTKKQNLPQLLWAMKTICLAAISQAASKQHSKSLIQWHSGLQHVLTAQNSLQHNPQSKLLLSDLLLNI